MGLGTSGGALGVWLGRFVFGRLPPSLLRFYFFGFVFAASFLTAL
jgi:uncharacterized membrane protein YfcA